MKRRSHSLPVLVASACLVALIALGYGASALGANLEPTLPSIRDLSTFNTAIEALSPTAVLTEPATAPTFASDVKEALANYKILYVMGVTPQDLGKVLPSSLVAAEVIDCAGTAVQVDESGQVVLMGSLVVDGPHTLVADLDAMTQIMNKAQTDASSSVVSAASESGFSAAAAPYYSEGPTWWWAGQVNDGSGNWIGRVEEYFVGHYLFNDSDPYGDHWVLEFRQSTDPGANGHGTSYQTKEVRNKFWKASPVTYVGDFQPLGTYDPQTISVGLPPEVSYSYSGTSVSVSNQSSTSYARWVHSFTQNTDHSTHWYQAKPAYQNDVPTRGTLKASPCYVTTEFAKVDWAGFWWSVKTNNWSPFTLTLYAP